MMTDPVNWFSRRPRWAFAAWLAIYVLGVSVTPLCTSLSPAESIYFWTGVIIIWYAVETHAMRKEMTRQIDRPIDPPRVRGLSL